MYSMNLLLLKSIILRLREQRAQSTILEQENPKRCGEGKEGKNCNVIRESVHKCTDLHHSLVA